MGRKPNLTLLTSQKKVVAKPVAPRIAGVPVAPAHLSTEAKTEWDRLAGPLYASGVLTAADVGCLGGYCQSYATWAQASELLKTTGLMIQTAAGGQVPHPLLGIQNKSRADMMRFAAELGLTPTSRARIVAIPPPDDDDPGSRYFE